MKNVFGTISGLVLGFISGTMVMAAITGKSFVCMGLVDECPARPDLIFWIGVIIITIIFAFVGYILTAKRS